MFTWQFVCPAREKGERVQASGSAGIVGAFWGLCFVAWIHCRSKAETKQTEAVFKSQSTTCNDERQVDDDAVAKDGCQS